VVWRVLRQQAKGLLARWRDSGKIASGEFSRFHFRKKMQSGKHSGLTGIVRGTLLPGFAAAKRCILRFNHGSCNPFFY
jgi:hypothetical protein